MRALALLPASQFLTLSCRPDRYTPLWGHNQYDKASEGGHQQQPRSSAERVPFDDVVRCMGELLAAGKIKVCCAAMTVLRLAV